MIEVYKIINGYATPIKANFFKFRENTHNLRNFQIILNKIKKNSKISLQDNILINLFFVKIAQRNTNSQII